MDYAGKHWSGLVADYYATRSRRLQALALAAARAGRATDRAAYARDQAALAYAWQRDTRAYPVAPSGDPVDVSRQLQAKYGAYFCACDIDRC